MYIQVAVASLGLLILGAVMMMEEKHLQVAHAEQDGLPEQPNLKVKNHYQYVIIGAGTTAYAAIETIFNHQPDADILIISDEAVRSLTT